MKKLTLLAALLLSTYVQAEEIPSAITLEEPTETVVSEVVATAVSPDTTLETANDAPTLTAPAAVTTNGVWSSIAEYQDDPRLAKPGTLLKQMMENQAELPVLITAETFIDMKPKIANYFLQQHGFGVVSESGQVTYAYDGQLLKPVGVNFEKLTFALKTAIENDDQELVASIRANFIPKALTKADINYMLTPIEIGEKAIKDNRVKKSKEVIKPHWVETILPMDTYNALTLSNAQAYLPLALYNALGGIGIEGQPDFDLFTPHAWVNGVIYLIDGDGIQTAFSPLFDSGFTNKSRVPELIQYVYNELGKANIALLRPTPTFQYYESYQSSIISVLSDRHELNYAQIRDYVNATKGANNLN